ANKRLKPMNTVVGGLRADGDTRGKKEQEREQFKKFSHASESDSQSCRKNKAYNRHCTAQPYMNRRTYDRITLRREPCTAEREFPSTSARASSQPSDRR